MVLPISEYDKFIEGITELGMPVEITSKDEYKVEISYKNDNMVLKFNSYLEKYPLLRTIQNAVYNKEDKKLIVPLSED